MNLRDLMAGIGVAIDDAFDPTTANQDDADADEDQIFRIVEQIERQWNLPFLTTNKIPPEDTWPSLLQAASFILLDWRLWRTGAAELEQDGIGRNLRFLDQAKDYFVPVFIFTNEDPEDVADRLPDTVYDPAAPEKNFIFLCRKADLIAGEALQFNTIEEWVRRNASVYALKTWEQQFHIAKRELFGSMYARSPDWPRVFWKAYVDDGVDPSFSLTHLLNDSLRGRMRTGAFEAEILGARPVEAPGDDLRALIGETSFRPQEALPENEIGCGDVFQLPQSKFLLNLRPDCDCVPRDGQEAGGIELYCIEGKRMRNREIREQYLEKYGHFDEQVGESVAFSVHDGHSIRFDFKKFRVAQFATLRDQRIGRLLHPYLTRIQQRFGLYLQRQGLPRIPREAIPPEQPTVREVEP